MIVAITGGTGFIGRKLVLHHLARDDEVRVLSRRDLAEIGLPDSVVWCHGNLSSSEGLARLVDSADILYHCAGEIKDVTRMEEVHVQGTRNLIDAAKGRIARWVQLSSVGVYGPLRRGVVTEESALNPVGEYEITKAESDCIVMGAAQQGGFEYSILRPSNVFGAGMTNQSLFGMISMINRGLFFYIGKPGASANYIHVENVVEGLVRCGTIREARGNVYNLSDHCTMEQIVSTIAQELGIEPPRLRLPELPIRMMARIASRFPGFPLTEARVDALTIRASYPSIKIEQELGYSHILTMEQGLADLVAAWKRKMV